MNDETHIEKVLLASSSVCLGVCCLILLVVLVSVLPDCRGFLAADFLLVFAVQCAFVATLLVVSMTNVSYALGEWRRRPARLHAAVASSASDNDTFINPTVDRASGFIVVFCLCIVAPLQLFLSTRRFIDYSFPSLL